MEDQQHDAMITFLARPTGRGGVDRALNEIVLGLVSGSYEPGDRLSASRIAKETGVGLVPVREALHLLAGQGVIEMLPQRGARVRGMSRAETESWHQVFQALTLIGIRTAAGLIREQRTLRVPLGEAQRVLDQLVDEVSGPAILNALLDYHRRLNAFCGLTLLDEASRRLQVVHWISFVARYAALVPHRAFIVQNYRRLSEALARGDADGACAAYNYECAFMNTLIRGDDIETPASGDVSS